MKWQTKTSAMKFESDAGAALPFAMLIAILLAMLASLLMANALM